MEVLDTQNNEEFKLELVWDEGREAYYIKAEPKKAGGYFHCGYKHRSDAESVMSNMLNLDVMGFRVNFQDNPPARVREDLVRPSK